MGEYLEIWRNHGRRIEFRAFIRESLVQFSELIRPLVWMEAWSFSICRYRHPILRFAFPEQEGLVRPIVDFC
jgi:hypothetical protein